MINLDNIFNAFESNPPQSEKGILIDLQKTQAFKLGMFKKIIWDKKNMDVKLGDLKKNMPELVGYIEIDEDILGEVITHTMAWSYLKDFDPITEQDLDGLKIFSDVYTLTACDLAISFWGEREHYEKCAHIKKISDLIKKNLPL